MEALTPYELERERTIARNREMMAKLNIPVLAANAPKAVRTVWDLKLSELFHCGTERGALQFLEHSRNDAFSTTTSFAQDAQG
eukprot:8021862-Pyramimonas_sp.AAC.2